MTTDRDGLLWTSRLYDAARAITVASSASEVAKAAFDYAVSELGARSAGLWLVEPPNIVFLHGVGLPDKVWARISVLEAGSGLPAAQCARAGEVIYYGSRAERDRRWPKMPPLDTGSEAAAILPLVVADQVIGCLSLGYPEVKEPDDFDFAHLSQLAALCAAGLHRARLYDAERERQSFLLDAWTALADAGGYADTLRRLAAIAVPRLADLCLIDVKDATQRVRRLAAVHADPSKAALAAELADRYAPDAGSPHPASAAMRTGRSAWSASMTDDFLRATTRDQHHFELVKKLGFTSYVSVPLVARGEVLGAMTLVSAGSGRRFDGHDLALAEELASRVASVVSAARHLDREHELVHDLQRRLLPERLPTPPGLEIAVRYLTAAREAEAGGDFYDVVTLPNGRVGLMVGDVEGHDATAAATMGQLRSAGRALAGQVREPAPLVDALRWSWDLLGFVRTATAVFGRIDPETGDTAMASAGHLPPVLVDRQGRAALVPVEPSPPFGLSAGPAIDHRFLLNEGSTLFFYTDGLVEHRHSTLADELSELCLFLEGSADVSLEQLCDRILVSHKAASLRQDDIALLAIRRLDRTLVPKSPLGADCPGVVYSEALPPGT